MALQAALPWECAPVRDFLAFEELRSDGFPMLPYLGWKETSGVLSRFCTDVIECQPGPSNNWPLLLKRTGLSSTKYRLSLRL